jgi:hypothetical protein
VAASALGVSLALAGCSSGHKGAGASGNKVTSTETPEQAVATSVKNLGAQSSLEIAFSVGLSQAQLEQLKDNTGKAPTPAEAKALSSGHFFLTFASGHGEALDSSQLRSDQQNSFDIGLAIGSDTPLELRVVNQSLFVRAQIQQLLTDVGQPPAQASKFTGELNQLNSFVPGLSSLAQGNWVEVNRASLQSLGAQLKQAAGSSASTPPPSAFAAQASRTFGNLLAAMTANSTFSNLGNSGGRSEFSMTLNVSNFLRAAVSDLQAFYTEVPVFGSKIAGSLGNATSSVPPGVSAVVDLFVSGNKLQEADLDANQFKHQLSGPLPLRATFSSPGAPAAPSGATNLDLSRLPALLGNLLKGFGASSSSSSSASG